MLKLILILSFIGYTSAITCTVKTCWTVSCARITPDTCAGTIKPRGGFCGCCDACITELGEGDACVPAVLLGISSPSQCAADLYCDTITSTCQRKARVTVRGVGSSCEPMILGITSPNRCGSADLVCDTKTNTCQQKVQVAVLGEGDSCVPRTLLGLSSSTHCDDGLFCDSATSTCKRKVQTPVHAVGSSCEPMILGITSPNRCGADLVCDTKTNTCQHKVTVPVHGVGSSCEPMILGLTPPDQCADGLFCDRGTHTCQHKVARTGRSYDQGPCAIRIVTIKAEQAQHFVYGKEEPYCDKVTGDFLGMQNSGSQSVCVTKNGTFIDGYMVYRWLADDMKCQCARDEYDYKQTGMVGKTFNCDTKGNYPSVGCTGSVCYCQDILGKQLGTSTVPIGSQDSLNC